MHRKLLPVVLVCLLVLFITLYAVGTIPLSNPSRIQHPRSGKPIYVPGKENDTTLLHSGWRIRPAGRLIPTGDMLLGGAFSPDGKTLAIANCGWGTHQLQLIDVETEKIVYQKPIVRAWNGIAWSPDGRRIYVSGGISNPRNDIHLFEKTASGEWEQSPGMKLTGAEAGRVCVAGLAISPDGKRLYALNNSDNFLYVLNTENGATVGRAQVGDHPIVCRIAPDGRRLFVANIGGNDVAVVDVGAADGQPVVTHRLATGEHPNDLALTADNRLFVSCGNADQVNVFDLNTLQPLEVIKVGLTPRAPLGSTPNALAASPDGKTLYVANADNNSVCVADISQRGKSRVRGFIPTGWYPTVALVTPDGRKVILGSGKGTGSRPNPARPPISQVAPAGFEYIGRQLNGLLAFMEPPTHEQLVEYTRQVMENSPYRDARVNRPESRRKTAIPTRVGDPSPIKYVLYIIKENRTYDQVFGDLPQGNGDPNLCLFGREVTPNQHALAEQFVLLDNTYCSGEVSADGHPWSTSAYVTDFNQRSWVLSYSGKGSTVRTQSVTDPKSGYIWEACARKGISYRSYGEYADHPTLANNHSVKWREVRPPMQATRVRDTDKAEVFIQEFKEFERTGNMPRFMIMSLGENHTDGTRPGAFTPKACVASNDLALGRIVETVSKSRYWKEFAIFVIEDDAQNGPDHVDSHRTVALVISPYARRNYVDSTMYNTNSVLRTMELILGLPPLTQHDAAATPMYESFTDKPDLTPYTALPARIDLNAKNPANAYGARQSAQMDFSEYDRIDEDALNRILWHSIKGVNVPYPPPVRRALISPSGRIHPQTIGEKDDD